MGQLISLLGDRIHQVALAGLVLGMTDSALATALVFLVATLPNLLLGPIAGTFVDRWDQQETMIVSDLLRAAAVLLIPVAAGALYPFYGVLLNPILAAAAMGLSSVTVVSNALRLRSFRP